MSAGAGHPADSHGTIRVRGAREHNLRDVDVDLRKRRLTAVTGVSGSGKSSLVFATIAAESRRMIDETYSAFVQGFMPTLARPDVDVLEGLTTAIIVDQERLGADPRSTVGTATDAGALLRILYSRLASPSIGGPKAFSFNVASVSGAGAITKADGTKERREFSVVGGMCPRCEGRGEVSEIDLDALVDSSRSLAEGAILVPGYSMDGWYGRIFSGSGYFDMNKPVGKFTKKEKADLFDREATKLKVEGINLTYEGLIPKMRKSMLSKDVSALQPHVRAFVERAVVFATCPDCGGSRLGEAARGARVDGVSIAEVSSWQITEALEWVRGLDEPALEPLLTSLVRVLEGFVAIGLGYLSLDRGAGTLSGGEAQRVKMVRHLGSALSDVTYVFDEPSIGLHPADIDRMGELLVQLRDKGNTVLIVEHKPALIERADEVVDLGPGAGTGGGQIVYQGDVAGLRASGTVTGRHLDDRARLKAQVRAPGGALEVRGASSHNLDAVDVDIPLGVLVAITGVAGSGKSSLVDAALAGREDVLVVDQSAIRGSRRSNPATYSGALEPIRKAFAKANGVKPALFSANSDGACPTCGGAGVLTLDLAVVAGVATPCDDCEGRRFKPEVLVYTFGGLSIADVLDLTVGEATQFFAAAESSVPAAKKILARLDEIGLGYIRLGQSLTTLSGGERQRLKLGTQMGGDASVYVLDEPTTGLHLADVEIVLAALDRLVDGGASVIVVEHHLAVMAHADHIIDIGPGAGRDGGRIVFTGTPAEMVADPRTVTGEYLRDYVGAS